MQNDLRVLRERHSAATDVLDQQQAGAPAFGSAAMICQTTVVDDYPTTAAVFYAVIPCYVNGQEAEGQAATYVPQTGNVAFVYNAGTQVPPQGTTIVAHAVGGRWVMRYDG